MFRKI